MLIILLSVERDIKSGLEAPDRPSRRLHASPASVAPGCAVPASGPPDCLRKLRQTGSVTSFELWPLRYRPRSATAPFAPEDGAKGLRLRSGLRRGGIGHRRLLRNRLGGFGRVGFPSLPLARGHWQARLSPSLPRPRTALRFPAPNCLRLRQRSGAAYPTRVGGRQWNIMLEIMRSTPLRSVQSGLRPHNLHYVSIASACFSPARPAGRCAWGFSRYAASAPHARAPLPVRPGGAP